ncbi:MAG: winged helix-turn-helix domain-containing protein [Alphaproteobacteria bacterium]|nr:winged helix-turn-helix domain-containing protein [Alphaproteobacteria bacterium]
MRWGAGRLISGFLFMLTCGALELDPAAQRLTRRGVEVPLSSQPLAILALLMSTPGAVVTRAELKRVLWPHAARIYTERRLNTAVRALREALGDVAQRPLYIKTVRGRGYRWIGHDTAAVQRQASWARPSTATSAPLTANQEAIYVRAVSMAPLSPPMASLELARLLVQKPDYAPARALDAALAMQRWRDAPRPKSLRAARRAVEVARAVGVANADLEAMDAELALKSNLDWRGAEQRYRTAIEREPSNAEARRGLAWLLLNSGRASQALCEVQTLLANSPLNSKLRADLGWFFLRAQRPALALSLCADGDVTPNLLSCRHTALARTGDGARSRLAALDLMTLVGAGSDEISKVRESGAQEGYQRFLDWRVARLAGDPTQWFQRAQAEAEAGLIQLALASLEQAFAMGDPSRFKLATTSEFESLRPSPRFKTLLRRVGA